MLYGQIGTMSSSDGPTNEMNANEKEKKPQQQAGAGRWETAGRDPSVDTHFRSRLLVFPTLAPQIYNSNERERKVNKEGRSTHPCRRCIRRHTARWNLHVGTRGVIAPGFRERRRRRRGLAESNRIRFFEVFANGWPMSISHSEV